MNEPIQISRRSMMFGLSALAAAPSLLRGAEVRRAGGAGIVDVHAHFQPNVLRALGMPGPMASWTLQKHLDDMAAAGVTRSLLSITTPGVPETGERARTLARGINEDAAKLAADNAAGKSPSSKRRLFSQLDSPSRSYRLRSESWRGQPSAAS